MSVVRSLICRRCYFKHVCLRQYLITESEVVVVVTLATQFCFFGGGNAYGAGLVLRLHRVFACLFLVIGVQYCFNVLIIYRPTDVTVASSTVVARAEDVATRHSEPARQPEVPQKSGQGRSGGQIGKVSTLASFLAELVTDFFFPAVRSSVRLPNTTTSLSMCPQPVSRPGNFQILVELSHQNVE